MKSILSVLFGLMAISCLYAMEDDQKKEPTAFDRRRYMIFKKIMQRKDLLQRTIALSHLQNRCHPDEPWDDIEKKILALLKTYDMYQVTIKDQGLACLKRKCIKYRAIYDPNMNIMQDLMILDWEDTVKQAPFQVDIAARMNQRLAKEEIKNIIYGLRFASEKDELDFDSE